MLIVFFFLNSAECLWLKCECLRSNVVLEIVQACMGGVPLPLPLPLQSEIDIDAVTRRYAVKCFALTRNVYNAVDETGKCCSYNAIFL